MHRMMNSKNTLVFNGQPLTIEDTCRKAGQQVHAKQSTQSDFIKRIIKGALFSDPPICLWIYLAN
jgi:histidine ammonia-lyase